MMTVMRSHVVWENKPRGTLKAEKFETAIERGRPWCDSWYGFCTWRYYAYLERGEPVAAMVWWCLRFIDNDPDPCTDEGYKDLCAYWEYKLPIALRRTT